MKPGRELDALIAEKVMGWKMDPAPFGPTQHFYQCWHQDGKPLMTIHMTPEFSTDIAAAWAVVYHVESLKDFVDWQLRSNCDMENYEDYHRYSAYFCVGKGVSWKSGETVPHAICLAALKATA